jgi:hypothetical protein
LMPDHALPYRSLLTGQPQSQTQLNFAHTDPRFVGRGTLLDPEGSTFGLGSPRPYENLVFP